MKKMLWFTDYNKRYEGSEPFFYPAQEIPEALSLEGDYARLKEELGVLWQNKGEKSTPSFGNYDSFDDKQFPPKSWQKMVFKVWDIKNKSICDRFPETALLLDKYPHITSLFLTKTSAHSTIRPHCGETNAHIRIHLGLNVPEVDASICGMEVGNQTIGWQNGKTFAFLDAHTHHVWNNSDTDRYVLIMDILRPEFKRYKHFICARVIVSQLFFYAASMMKIRHLNRVSSAFLDYITYFSYLPTVFIIQINNRIGLLKL